MGLTGSENNSRVERTKNIVTFGPKDNKSYVFISYKSDDWETVLVDIVKKIQNDYGLRVYYDKNFEKDNDSWIDNMNHAISSSHCKMILSFVSKKYMKSYACLMELLFSMTNTCSLCHEDKRIPIIPIIIDDSNNIAETVSKSAEKIEVNEWGEYEKLLRKLCEDRTFEKEKEKLSNVIKVLYKEKDKATLELLSNVMRHIFFDAYLRTWNRTESFYENLVETIKKEKGGDDVFDLELIGKHKPSEANKPSILVSEDGKEKNVNIKLKSENCESMLLNSKNASKTYVEIIQRLIIENPSKIQRILGKIVSKNPHNFDSDTFKVVKEFQVHGVRYYVNTHSSTSYKINQLKEILNIINSEVYDHQSISQQEIGTYQVEEYGRKKPSDGSKMAIAFGSELNEKSYSNLYVKIIKEICLNVSNLHELNPKIVSSSRLGFDSDVNKQVRSFTANRTELFVNVHSDTKTKIAQIALLCSEMGFDAEKCIQFFDVEINTTFVEAYKKTLSKKV